MIVWARTAIAAVVLFVALGGATRGVLADMRRRPGWAALLGTISVHRAVPADHVRRARGAVGPDRGADLPGGAVRGAVRAVDRPRSGSTAGRPSGSSPGWAASRSSSASSRSRRCGSSSARWRWSAPRRFTRSAASWSRVATVVIDADVVRVAFRCMLAYRYFGTRFDCGSKLGLSEGDGGGQFALRHPEVSGIRGDLEAYMQNEMQDGVPAQYAVSGLSGVSSRCKLTTQVTRSSTAHIKTGTANHAAPVFFSADPRITRGPANLLSSLLLHFQPELMQQRFRVTARLLSSFEHQRLRGLEGDRDRSPAPSVCRAGRPRSAHPPPSPYV